VNGEVSGILAWAPECRFLRAAVENELDARVERLYRRVSTGLRQDRIATVWVRFEVRAASDDEAMALVRDQLHAGADRGATLREVRVDHPRWDAAPVLPREPIDLAGEASF
jgi:hypothetical protein